MEALEFPSTKHDTRKTFSYLSKGNNFNIYIYISMKNHGPSQEPQHEPYFILFIFIIIIIIFNLKLISLAQKTPHFTKSNHSQAPIHFT